jgi:hypothetical protein
VKSLVKIGHQNAVEDVSFFKNRIQQLATITLDIYSTELCEAQQ